VGARGGTGWLLLAALFVPALAWAGIRWDWSAEEIVCARKIGVNLGGAPKDKFFVRQMTWLSDAVVTGTVTRVEHDPSTGFRTTVVLAVESVHKGEQVLPTIEIVLNDGPFYSEVYGGMVEVDSGEPSFKPGEKVLVFLTGGTFRSHIRGMNEVSLAPQQFGVVDSGKWTIQQDGTGTFGYVCAEDSSCGPQRVDRITWMEKEIERARTAQATLCRR